MKSKYFLLLALVLVTHFAIAQNKNKVTVALKAFNNDTATFLKQKIAANSRAYIGKPLDSLLVDLPSVSRYANNYMDTRKDISTTMVLYFASSAEVLDKLSKRELPALLVITWATPLNRNDVIRAGLIAHSGNWTTAAYDYYKTKIVSNVDVVHN